MSRASGILFVSLSKKALFLRRTSTALDFPEHWCFPAGGQEGDETAQQTAIRETREEIGFLPEGERILLTRTASPRNRVGLGTPVAGSFPVPPPDAAPMPDVDFSTFLQKVTNEFTPELNDEHDGWCWAPLDSPPGPLHPGCQIALDRLSMNELDVARAIADGRLRSPQKYENMWLFAIRITGTSTAFRPKNEEFVYRRPEHYLNDEFLARCNGLPVIWKHPKDSPLLTGKEFIDRVVGTVFLPYISGTEVWAVAKIFIEGIAQKMEEGLSTSPGVNFEDFSVNARLTLEDGTDVFIEGDPSLLDHIAVCELGVWDKGGVPAGIRSEAREDSAMTPEEQAAADKAKKDAMEAEEKAKKDAAEEAEKKAKEDAARKDADVGEKLDKVLSHLDSANTKLDAFGKRLDAVETKDRGDAAMMDKARKDAEEKDKKEKEEAEKVAADKAKKDADEEMEKKAKEDAAKKDSALADEIKRVESMIPKSIGDADYYAMTDSQSRADEIYALFGKHAPRPLAGQTPATYERKVVRDLLPHSPTWKGKDVATAFADDAVFAVVRDQVYAEARVDAMSPATAPDGGLREITRRTAGGHTVKEFVGDARNWMYPLSGPVRKYGTGMGIDDSAVRGGRR